MKCQPTSLDVIKFEIDIVRKMIRDERWYEGERQHHEVSEKEIERKINELILVHGEKMRNETVKILISEMCVKMNHECKKCPYCIPFT